MCGKPAWDCLMADVDSTTATGVPYSKTTTNGRNFMRVPRIEAASRHGLARLWRA
jgi:hypothetical protein